MSGSKESKYYNSKTHEFQENVRLGLQSLEEEEENLFILKDQLLKIKKIRQDQIKKDDTIETLRERIAVLEHERLLSNRQHAELQEIMSERIKLLEKSLNEKKGRETEILEYQSFTERIEAEKVSFRVELEQERKRNQELKEAYKAKTEEISKMRITLNREDSTVQQMSKLFEALKLELSKKEKSLEDLSIKNNHATQQYKQEISDLKQSLADQKSELEVIMREKHNLNSKLQDTLIQLETEKEDKKEKHDEGDKWKARCKDTEALAEKLKTQILSVRTSLTDEIHNLKLELNKSRNGNDQTSREINEFKSIINTIAEDIAHCAKNNLFHSFSYNNSHQHHSEEDDVASPARTHLNLESMSPIKLQQKQEDLLMIAKNMKISCRSDNVMRSFSDLNVLMTFVSDIIVLLVQYQRAIVEKDKEMQRTHRNSETATAQCIHLEEKLSRLEKKLDAKSQHDKEKKSHLELNYNILLEEKSNIEIELSREKTSHNETKERYRKRLDEVALLQASLHQMQAVCKSLEDRVRERDKTIAAARALEDAHKNRIEQLERTKRLSSLAILKEIHDELKSENSSFVEEPENPHKSEKRSTRSKSLSPELQVLQKIESPLNAKQLNMSLNSTSTGVQIAPTPITKTKEWAASTGTLYASQTTNQEKTREQEAVERISTRHIERQNSLRQQHQQFQEKQNLPLWDWKEFPKDQTNEDENIDDQIIKELRNIENLGESYLLGTKNSFTYEAPITPTENGQNSPINTIRSAPSTVQYGTRAQSPEESNLGSSSFGSVHTYASSNRKGYSKSTSFANYHPVVQKSTSGRVTNSYHSMPTEQLFKKHESYINSSPVEDRTHILEIFSDIGRLTGKLESRLRLSSTGSATSLTKNHHSF